MTTTAESVKVLERRIADNTGDATALPTRRAAAHHTGSLRASYGGGNPLVVHRDGNDEPRCAILVQDATHSIH
ncbi:MAG: hypothetical protein M3466_03480 [Gemmatimonadota bacterium]|nr:hypothetical protein [Gemmatimonadota bacterium]